MACRARTDVACAIRRIFLALSAGLLFLTSCATDTGRKRIPMPEFADPASVTTGATGGKNADKATPNHHFGLPQASLHTVATQVHARVVAATNSAVNGAEVAHGHVSSNLVLTVDRVDRDVAAASARLALRASRTNLADTVNTVDSVFGDRRMQDDNRGTRVTVGLGVSYEREEGAAFENDVSVRVSMPRMEDRLQMLADSAVDVADPDEIRSFRKGVEADDPEAGLRYIFAEGEEWKFHADAGVKIGSPAQVFTKFRGRVTVPCDVWQLYLADTVKWYSEDGLQDVAEMRWSRFVHRGWLFRSSSTVEWAEDEDGVTPSQSFSIFRKRHDHSIHRWIIGGTWPESPDVTKARYGIEYSVRWLIHRNWLFVEVRPGIEFPQVVDYEPSPTALVMVSCVFGDTRLPPDDLDGRPVADATGIRAPGAGR